MNQTNEISFVGHVTEVVGHDVTIRLRNVSEPDLERLMATNYVTLITVSKIIKIWFIFRDKDYLKKFFTSISKILQ